jgi:hypothetical protein
MENHNVNIAGHRKNMTKVMVNIYLFLDVSIAAHYYNRYCRKTYGR